MMHPPIHNPMIPFIGPIPGGCQPGTLIDIQGHVPLHSTRFAVNIQCGPNVSPRDDVAFHINVDFLQNRIVRNSISQLQWGHEEAHGYMPLTKGQPFSIVILCETSKFNLAINGAHFTEMTHRLPLHRASHLAIDGEVTISSIQFSGGNAMPPGQVGFNPATLSYTPGYNGHTPYPTGPGVPGQPYPNTQQAMYPGQQLPYPGQPGMPGYGQPAYGYPNPQYPHSHTHKPTGILEKAGLALGGAGLMSALGAKGYGGGSHHNHYPGGVGYPHPQHGGGGGGSMLGMGATGLGAGLVGATLAHKLSPKKALKSNKKAAKKALKYGVPIAGLGIGAYTVGKILHRSSSSSG
ncbi:hypothetical protein WDU94_012765 [Cyamophila willieti]